MRIPDDRKYSGDHVWVVADGSETTLGITDHAQDELGELTYLDLPEPGKHTQAGVSMGEIESIKTVSQFVSPVTGIVSERNQAVLDQPTSVNSDPYSSWLVKVRLEAQGELDGLLSAEDYRRLTEG
jgi:glycine cleavage system H protein